MKLAIVGSRTFTDYDFLENSIVDNYKISNIQEIVSGGATGADSLAEMFAKKYKINFTVFLPEWNKYGKSAGAIRNKLIVENCDQVLAFWDGESKGTKITIDIAKRLGKKCKIIKIDE